MYNRAKNNKIPRSKIASLGNCGHGMVRASSGKTGGTHQNMSAWYLRNVHVPKFGR